MRENSVENSFVMCVLESDDIETAYYCRSYRASVLGIWENLQESDTQFLAVPKRYACACRWCAICKTYDCSFDMLYADNPEDTDDCDDADEKSTLADDNKDYQDWNFCADQVTMPQFQWESSAKLNYQSYKVREKTASDNARDVNSYKLQATSQNPHLSVQRDSALSCIEQEPVIYSIEPKSVPVSIGDELTLHSIMLESILHFLLLAIQKDQHLMIEKSKVRTSVSGGRSSMVQGVFGKTYILVFLLSSTVHGSTLTASLNTEHETVYAGQTNAFTCGIATREVSHIEWLTHNYSLDGTIPGVTTHVVPAGTETIGILNIDAVAESFNNVTFRCRVILSSGSVVVSNAITLEVLGGPPDVNVSSYLDGAIVKFFWDPVSILVISYCVNISNSIGAVIHSECGIIGASYEFEAENFDDIGCGNYSAVVCAVNPAGRNCSGVLSISRRHLFLSNITLESFNSTNEKLITIRMFDMLCVNTTTLPSGGIYWIYNKHPRILNIIGLDNFVSSLVIRDEPLETVATIISTYDIQSTIVTAPSDNMIQLTSSFVHKSQAIGVLYGLISPDNHAMSTFMLFSKENATSGIVEKLSKGFYQVLSYDIESDHTISGKSPAFCNNITVSGDTQPMISPLPQNNNCTINFEESMKRSIHCFCSERMTYHVLIATFPNGKAELETQKGDCGSPVFFSSVLTEDLTGIFVFLQNEKNNFVSSKVYFQDFYYTTPKEEDTIMYTTMYTTSKSAYGVNEVATWMFLCLLFVVIVY